MVDPKRKLWSLVLGLSRLDHIRCGRIGWLVDEWRSLCTDISLMNFSDIDKKKALLLFSVGSCSFLDLLLMLIVILIIDIIISWGLDQYILMLSLLYPDILILPSVSWKYHSYFLLIMMDKDLMIAELCTIIIMQLWFTTRRM